MSIQATLAKSLANSDTDWLSGYRAEVAEKVEWHAEQHRLVSEMLSAIDAELEARTVQPPCTCKTRQWGDPLCPRADRNMLPSLPPGYAT